MDFLIHYWKNPDLCPLLKNQEQLWSSITLKTKSLILSVTITIAKLVDTYLQKEFSTARSGNWSDGFFFFFCYWRRKDRFCFALVLVFWLFMGEKKERMESLIGLERCGMVVVGLRTCLIHVHVQYTYLHHWWYEAASLCNWAGREGGIISPCVFE